MMDSNRMKKVAVLGLNRIGDAIYILPVFETFFKAYSDTQVDVFTPSQVRDIYIGNPYINQVYAYPKKQFWKATLAQLKADHYDECVVLHNGFKYALLPFLAGIPVRVGYEKELRSFLLTRHRSLPKKLIHRLEHNAQILDLLDLDMRGILPRIYLEEADEQSVQRLLLESDLKPKQFIAFIVGSIAQTRRWFPENFAAVIDQLYQKYQLPSVILGGPDDVKIAKKIYSLCDEKTPVTVLAGNTSLRETMQLFSQSLAVVSNDTGPMHVASALGCEVVTWFGAASEDEIAPPSPKTTILNAHVSCGPCVKEVCPEKTLECLHKITPEMVVNEIENKRLC